MTKTIGAISAAVPVKNASSASEGYLEQIEERLRARAGNPVVPQSAETITEKVKVKKGSVYGSGISEEEIQKIIKEFNA